MHGNPAINQVQIIPAADASCDGARWLPVTGEETTALLEHVNVPAASRPRLVQEAASVLSRCVPPADPTGRTTGLVVGYIQSGKTVSFTTVAALARDNGYSLVIVISGTTTNLFRQSADRLEADLRIKTRDDRAWHMLKSPLRQPRDERAVRGTLDRWRIPSHIGQQPPTVLLAVMKNGRHLDSLIKVLTTMTLGTVQTLIIDDEADQAGLNTLVARGEQSPTYSRLLRLRQCLPHHSYLQYTATPRGPLLINILDALSPDFAEVLTPGPDYTGGLEFFDGMPGLVHIIPPSDIPSPNQPITEPPESLLEAMRLFLIGVAIGWWTEKGRGNRSMMVHPSQATMPHAQYFQWVEHSLADWSRIINAGPKDHDYQDLLDDFANAYDDIARTYAAVPPFPDLIPFLQHAMLETHVEEVNTRGGQTPKIDWKTRYAFILVGGEVLSRGYTVEGLTVTYMPRGSGVGNADTIQQRGRFFGYKRRYLGLCRVFLEVNVQHAFTEYTEHEEDIRGQLVKHRDTKSSLHEWKRALVLDLALKPTRDNILDVAYSRGEFADDWYYVHRPLDAADTIQHNREVVQAFVRQLPFQEDRGDPRRTQDEKHLIVTDVPLRDAYVGLLSQLAYTQQDESPTMTRLLVQLERYLQQHPDERCDIYLMNRGEVRQRSVRDDRIINLFQGKNPKAGPPIYPGDRELRVRDTVTIQMHLLRLTLETRAGAVLADRVPVLAVWVPQKMGKPILVQQT